MVINLRLGSDLPLIKYMMTLRTFFWWPPFQKEMNSSLAYEIGYAVILRKHTNNIKTEFDFFIFCLINSNSFEQRLPLAVSWNMFHFKLLNKLSNMAKLFGPTVLWNLIICLQDVHCCNLPYDGNWTALLRKQCDCFSSFFSGSSSTFLFFFLFDMLFFCLMPSKGYSTSTPRLFPYHNV